MNLIHKTPFKLNNINYISDGAVVCQDKIIGYDTNQGFISIDKLYSFIIPTELYYISSNKRFDIIGIIFKDWTIWGYEVKNVKGKNWEVSLEVIRGKRIKIC